MTAHLLLIAIGPVQEFIAQARRTRDLWFGSQLLSELSRKVAVTLAADGGVLIFPALKNGDPELQNCLSPLRSESKLPPLNIANKILAEVPEGIDPQRLARTAREALKDYWRDTVANDVKRKCGGLLADGIDGVWIEQIDSMLEFAAAWAPLGNYAATCKGVEQAIAARKNLRDFEPWRRQRGNRPKSSLDGARESVLRNRPQKREPALAHKYRIADAEQLDAVGLVKRAGGEPDQFIPIVNVALASWVAAAQREAPHQLDTLRRACAKHALARVTRDLPCVMPFPFDASILLPNRWRPVFEEQGLQGNPEDWGRVHVRPLLKRMSEPYPYVACLVADGDVLGRAIDGMSSAPQHREFSRQLAGFAGDARNIIEQRFFGSLVYSGGDDVLAFLPVTEALHCADALRERFTEIMALACSFFAPADRPTLSVGIGIGHVMEGMGDLLGLGRRAEKLAKGTDLLEHERDRNALAILLDKRSGGTRSWRTRWNEWGGDPIARLDADVKALKEILSRGKVYEIARLLGQLPESKDVSKADQSGWSQVLGLEVVRSLSRVEVIEGSQKSSSIEAFNRDIGLSLDRTWHYARLRHEVSSWVDRMLIASTLVEGEPNAHPRTEEAVA